MEEFAHTVFGREGPLFLRLLEGLAPNLTRYRYWFTDDEAYANVFRSHPQEAMRIYWAEILQRAHIAAATSILRHQRWAEATLESFKTRNFLSFSANLRGLIESAADAYDGLDAVPFTLAEHYKLIRSAVEGESTKTILAGELENQLVHYTHAKRLKRGANLPDHLRAKTSKEYLDRLQGAEKGPVHDCYAELCQIVHPTYSSVFLFLSQDESGMTLIRPIDDLAEIKNFCQQNAGVFPRIFRWGLNPALMTLKVLNIYNIEELFTPDVEALDMSDIVAWQKIIQLLRGQGIRGI